MVLKFIKQCKFYPTENSCKHFGMQKYCLNFSFYAILYHTLYIGSYIIYLVSNVPGFGLEFIRVRTGGVRLLNSSCSPPPLLCTS